MSADLKQISQLIAREVAGDDWNAITRVRRDELIRESFDAITREIPSTPFAEKCLRYYRNPPLPPEVEEAVIEHFAQVAESLAIPADAKYTVESVGKPIRLAPEISTKDAPKGKRK